MSAKWERSKRWDDEHIPAALWPIKRLLRALSSVWLAVILLSLVAAYGILASIPIGMLAQIPTYLIYGLTLVLTIAVVAGVPWLLARRMLQRQSRAARFAILFFLTTGLALGATFFWFSIIWPLMRWDPATGRGLMLFSSFVKANGATTLRRLPVLEMSELEFYSWWPLRVILLLFVLNLVVATVRRIEFIFVNIGVLTVHTGIVVIALGSVYYSGLKQEGDTILLAGRPDSSGVPVKGPPQEVFYDNTDISLYIGQDRGPWEDRRLSGVPRYNDYNLAAASGRTAMEASRRALPWLKDAPQRSLGIDVPPPPRSLIDPGLSFRLVGFASYAEPFQDWVQAVPPPAPAMPPAGETSPIPNPLRIIYLLNERPDDHGKVSPDPAFAFTLLPAEAKSRITENEALSVEYTVGMSDSRWADLTSALPNGAEHAFIVEVPSKTAGEPAFRAVYPVAAQQDIKVGETGYTLKIEQLAAQPPFPIITPGYRDAPSSMAVVHVTPPDGKAYDRWVYSRFPEISQDMLEELNERGMPRRRDPDPAISIRYVDATRLHVYFDDRPDGTTRVLVRQTDGAVRTETLGPDGTLKDMVAGISLRLGDRWAHAVSLERPAPVPDAKRDRSLVGTRDKAMLAVEVSLAHARDASGQPWKRLIWLPFTKYLSLGMGTDRTIDLPDGRKLRLAFARRQHPLGRSADGSGAGFQVSLVNFEMIAYDHRGAPRDYQSVLRVEPTDGRFQPYEHVTKLNAPLRAPFMWSGVRSWFANTALTLGSGLNPFQYKLSQAGWDAEGWKQTQQLADQKLIPRAYASFTILGVGNNPGIHIVAAGAVLMAVGIPWAFYVKPWIIRRRKAKIQAQLAAGTYKPPARRGASHPTVNGSANGEAASTAPLEPTTPERVPTTVSARGESR